MKQPDLGKKVSELRKAKGLTQEELVEKCNISVRTLQRIETGEVTPRSYTLKTILAALDNDLHTIEVNEDGFMQRAMQWTSGVLISEHITTVPSDAVVKQLNASWMFGILYLLIGFIEGAADYFRFKENVLIYGITVYVIIKIAALIALVLFQRGFIIIGKLFDNYLLRIISFILIWGEVLFVGYDIASIFYDAVERQYVMGTEAVVFGWIIILYGIALRRLRPTFGAAAGYAGIFHIIAGCFFLTVILSFLGFVMQVPAELCGIFILYKSVALLQKEPVADGRT